MFRQPDGVLSAKENSWRIFNHVVVGGGIAGNDRRSQDVVVVSRRTCIYEKKKVKLFFLLQITKLFPLLAIVLILIPTLSAGPGLLHGNLILLGNFAV